MSLDIIANVVGMLGTALVVGAYFLLQLNRIDPKGLAYNVLNIVGSLLLLLSLLVHFNLASMVIQIFWIAASLVGLYKFYRRTHSTEQMTKPPT